MLLVWLACLQLALSSAASVSVEMSGNDSTCSQGVGPCLTLAQAVQLAGAGGVVSVGPGNFTGRGNCNVTISHPITLRSSSPLNGAVFDCGHATRCLIVNADAEVSGITFSRGRSGGGPVVRRDSYARARTGANTEDEGPPIKTLALVSSTSGSDPKITPLSDISAADFRDAFQALDAATREQVALWIGHLIQDTLLPLKDSNQLHPLRSSVLESPPPTMQLRNASCVDAPPDSVDGCGGANVLTDWCGHLTEGSSGQYLEDSACTWIIEPVGAASIEVAFTMLDVEAAPKCAYDSLTISQLVDGDEEVLGSYCGTMANPICSGACPELAGFVTTGTLIIRLKSDSSTGGLGFALSWISSDVPPPIKKKDPPGGCILVQEAALTLRSVNIQDCIAPSGGGLAAEHASVIISHSLLTRNVATEELCDDHEVVGGGGIWLNHSTAALEHTTINANHVLPTCSARFVTAAGGAVLSQGGNFSAQFCQFVNNRVNPSSPSQELDGWGGGLSMTGTHTFITASLISNNSLTCTNSAGGGLYFDDANFSLSLLNITENVVRGYFAAQGGGVSCWNSHVVVSSSLFLGNVLEATGRPEEHTRVAGGGLQAHTARVLISNSAFRNHSLVSTEGRYHYTLGGGVMVEDANLSIADSEFMYNSIGFMPGFRPSSVYTTCIMCFGYARGGALYVLSSTSSLLRSNMTGSLIHGASEAAGGSVFVEMSNSTFTSCECTSSVLLSAEAWGGSLAVLDESHVVIKGCSFGNNHLEGWVYGALGGSVFLEKSECTVESTHMANNSVFGSSQRARGGSVYVAYGTALISNSVLEDNVLNTTGGCEGGILFAGASNVSVVSSLLRSGVLREARHAVGGLISANYMFFDGWFTTPRTNLTVLSSTLSGALLVPGNSLSLAEGGGIWARFATVVMWNSSVTSNSLSPGFYQATGGAFHAEDSNVTIEHSVFENNTIQATKRAQGGGLFFFISNTDVLSSIVRANTVIGGEYAGGGGISVSYDYVGFGNEFIAGRTTVADCLLNNNNSTANKLARGGAVEVHRPFNLDADSITLVLSRTTLWRNVCSGRGGALSMESTPTTVHECSFRDNYSWNGGAIYASGSDHLHASGTVLQRNLAAGIAGAILVVGFVQTRFSGSRFEGNSAPMADNVFAYGSGLVINMTNVSMVSNGSYSTFTASAEQAVRFNDTEIGSSNLGWECIREVTPIYQVVRFNRCARGNYLTVPSTTKSEEPCQPCPTGAFCQGGKEVWAQISHWGALVNGSALEMYRCPSGYCCPRAQCEPFNFCDGNREGRLCGLCREGFSQAIGSLRCLPNSECDALRDLLLGGFAVTFCFVASVQFMQSRKARALHRRDNTVPHDGGELKATIFFYQILPLIVSSHTVDGQSRFLAITFSVFNLELDSTSDGGGLCPYSGFSAISKILVRFFVPAVSCCWIVVFCLGHTVWRQRKNREDYRGFAAHAATGIVVIGLGFSTLVKATFELVSCTRIEGSLVLFVAAETECFQTWQVLILGLATPLLVFFPACLAWIVYTIHHAADKGRQSTVTLQLLDRVIAGPYDTTRCNVHRWESVLMVERILLISIGVFVTHPIWRAWGLVITMLPMLTVQVLHRPFARRGPNYLMSLNLMLLIAMGPWEIAVTVYQDQGAVIDGQISTVFSYFAALFTTSPLILCFILRVASIVGPKWEARRGRPVRGMQLEQLVPDGKLANGGSSSKVEGEKHGAETMNGHGMWPNGTGNGHSNGHINGVKGHMKKHSGASEVELTVGLEDADGFREPLAHGREEGEEEEGEWGLMEHTSSEDGLGWRHNFQAGVC